MIFDMIGADLMRMNQDFYKRIFKITFCYASSEMIKSCLLERDDKSLSNKQLLSSPNCYSDEKL